MSRAADLVHPIIPLALLEALQDLDTPVADDLPDIAQELIAKRLGRSETIVAQAERYEQRIASSATVAADEAVALFILLARRPDHELLFADAGRRAARRAVRHLFPVGTALRQLLPAGVDRRLGAARARRILARVFGGTLTTHDGLPAFTVSEPLSVRGGGDGRGCIFYGAAFAEVLRLLLGYEGAVQHIECCSHGGTACRWHTVPPSEFTQ